MIDIWDDDHDYEITPVGDKVNALKYTPTTIRHGRRMLLLPLVAVVALLVALLIVAVV